MARTFTPYVPGRRRRNLSYEHTEEANGARTFSYGKFDLNYSINFEGIKLSFEEKSGLCKYKRAFEDWKKEANISAKGGHAVICPIEPFMLPDNVTEFLEIDFEAVKIAPSDTCVLFLTFPLEIGVFLEDENGNSDLLDVISYVYPKYSLYGQASRGAITRLHKSKVYFEFPRVRNHKYGILRLEIDNRSGEWVDVGKVVIYGKGLTLYYDDICVFAGASMSITSQNVATVAGVSVALNSNMKESISVFSGKKLWEFCNAGDPIDTMFTMDMGLI